MQQRNLFGILSMLVLGTVGLIATASADCVIEARTAAIRSEGGPNADGGWNLWSHGRVGQPLRFQDAGTYGIVVRAWGSSAGGVRPEMALLVDGKAVKTVTVGRQEPDGRRTFRLPRLPRQVPARDPDA